MDSSAAIAEIGQLYQSLADTDPDIAVSVILKLRGETSDIDCLYCYTATRSARRPPEEPGSSIESWLDLFDSVYPDLHIGISLDGDPEGNAWRVSYNSVPTAS